MDRLYAFTNLFWNIILQVFVIRCYCKLLNIQAKRTFMALEMFNLIAAAVIQNLLPEPFMLLRLLVLGPVNSFALPIAFSKEPMVKRILRTMIVVAGAAAPEFMCAMTYATLTGTFYPLAITEATVIEVSLSYLLGITGGALLYEAIIIAFGRPDRQLDTPIGPPVIGLLVLTYGLFAFATYRFYAVSPAGHISLAAICICLACTFLTLVLAFVAISLAEKDLEAGASAADHAAMMRQAKHLRAEIESSARHTRDLAILRHDLANQIDVVAELLSSGHVSEAERHLAELQLRAHRLTGGGT